MGLMVRRAAIQLLQEFPVFSIRGRWRGGIVFCAWLKRLHHTINVYLLLQQAVLCLYFEYFFCHSSSVLHNRDSKNPDSGVVTSPHAYSLLPSCCPATELRATSKFNSKQPRKTKPRKGQRRRTFTCSHQSWLKKSESEMSDVEPSSEFFNSDMFESYKRLFFVIVPLHWCCFLLPFLSSGSSVSEAGRSDRYAESVTSASTTSSRSSQHCHGSCARARSLTELTNNR